MSEEDEYRVEARLAGASRGVSPTTEQIQTLLERQRNHEKLTRPPPQKAFARVMGEQGGGPAGDNEGEPSQDDAEAQQGSEAAPASSAASKPQRSQAQQPIDSFVRRTLPVGLQRSGRTKAPLPAPKPAQRAPLPDGPQARQVSATEPMPHVEGKKIIIRG